MVCRMEANETGNKSKKWKVLHQAECSLEAYVFISGPVSPIVCTKLNGVDGLTGTGTIDPHRPF